jgi:hypothetical protein
LSSFNDPEIYFRVPLQYHAGMIVKSKDQKRVKQLLDEYTERLEMHFSTVVDAPEVKKFH